MIEQIVIGLVQGIAEWLPISSEAAVVLTQTYFFGNDDGLESLVQGALFLHLGTVLAAIVYFRKDVKELIPVIFKWNESSLENKKMVNYLIGTTIISGGVGFLLLKSAFMLESSSVVSENFIMLFVGLLLIITGILQRIKSGAAIKKVTDITWTDTVLLGVIQGFSALPGLSRSGLTVAGLLLRRFDKEQALRLSFLMSIPIVIAGNIVLAIDEAVFEPISLVGLLVAFIAGLITIDLFLKLARRINFGNFVIGFGIFSIVAGLM